MATIKIINTARNTNQELDNFSSETPVPTKAKATPAHDWSFISVFSLLSFSSHFFLPFFFQWPSPSFLFF